jgi:hypothetical protein
MNLAIVLLSAGVGFAWASAEHAPTFEESLGALEGTVRASREERAQARYSDLALEIDRAAREASEAAWSVRYLRGGIAEVGRLSRERYSDPALGRAIERLLWDMNQWQERASSLATRVQRMALLADRRDPRLRAPAFNLVEGARGVEGEARMAGLEARDASAGLRRLGRRIEAESLERKVRRMSDVSRMLESEARRLLDRVR